MHLNPRLDYHRLKDGLTYLLKHLGTTFKTGRLEIEPPLVSSSSFFFLPSSFAQFDLQFKAEFPLADDVAFGFFSLVDGKLEGGEDL